MPSKLLIIALDGAHGRLLEAMSYAGELPCLAELRRRGTFRFLDNSGEMSDDSIWASFQYGAPLADHGRYHFLARLQSGRVGMVVKEEDGNHTFWQRLSAQGLSVCVIDVPKCPLPVPLNGIQLADWSVHGHYFKAPQSYPAEFARQVVAEFDLQECKSCSYLQPLPDDDEVRNIVSDLMASIEAKRRVAIRELERASWDLAIIGFKEAHCAGHGLWQLADRKHAEFDAERVARLGDPVGAIYRALDAAAGDLMSAAGCDAEIVVFSNCYMEPNGSVLALQEEICNRLDEVFSRRYGGHQPVDARALPSHRFCAKVETNDNQLGLKLSRLSPALFTAMLNEATAMLAGLRDAETGLTVFDRIDQPSTLRQGKAAGKLPDIVAWCRSNATPRTVVSPELGRIDSPAQRVRPGNHAMGGAVFAAGPRVRALSARLTDVSDFAELSRAFFVTEADSPLA